MSELQVALTFDAEHPSRSHCPPGNPERLLDTLGDAGVLATFFIQGRWARSYPATARRIATEGHLIGHHSRYHAPFPLLTDEGILADVHEGQANITGSTGVDPRPWFRCPFGEGHDDPRVLAILEGCGYRDVGWHVDAHDWDADMSVDDVVAGVVEGVRTHGDGAVVLMHTWPATTAEALPAVIDSFGPDGVEFVDLTSIEVLP